MSLQPSAELRQIINDFYSHDTDVNLVSLCTPDGFEIHQSSMDKFQAVPDKISAIASTLSSISDSIANEIIESPFKVTTIETNEGNFVCIYTQYLQQNVVLTICAGSDMSLGVLRVKTRHLATAISTLDV